MGIKICLRFCKLFFNRKAVVLIFLFMVVFDNPGRAKQNRQVTRTFFSGESPPRQIISLNPGWRFHYRYDVRKTFSSNR
jgi:hypothetical protein